jgi:hypothetical protein
MTMGRTIKWTYERRFELYTQLVKRFGPYHTWGHKHYPKGKKAEYKQFLKNYAVIVTFLTGQKTTSAAVGVQIGWAVYTAVDVAESMTHNYFRNIVAAMDAGFILPSFWPNTIIQNRPSIY